MRDDDGKLRPSWRELFGQLGADGLARLNEKSSFLARQIRDNGITYNVYADENGPARPWSLDLMPLLIDDADRNTIRAGVAQRASCLNAAMADAYGEQRALREGLLPPALLQGHPDFLQPMAGYRPPGDIWLHMIAFDLARSPDGRWWIVSQRTQAPSGAGYVLENRITISRTLADPFRNMNVRRLADFYSQLLDTLHQVAPGSGSGAGAWRSAYIALLTPGPYNETYFEHAYLARYLGISLVQGSDLVVRDCKLYIKTLDGLEPVDVLFRRLDDVWCDPLELRPDSTLSIPGLIEAVRAGNVTLANALDSGWLESPGLMGFLPGLSKALTGSELLLHSLPSWWCGERGALEQILPRLDQTVIKRTYSAAGFKAVISAALDDEAREHWAAQIRKDPSAYTVQEYLPLSQMPVWNGSFLASRAVMLRVFAVADGRGGYRVLLGGLGRIARDDQNIVAMQRGGSNVDAWVLAPEPQHSLKLSEMMHAQEARDIRNARRTVSSRAAENLFWLGRNTERSLNSVQTARVLISRLSSDNRAFSAPLIRVLTKLADYQGLLPAGAAAKIRSAADMEQALLRGLLPRQVGAESEAPNRAAEGGEHAPARSVDLGSVIGRNLSQLVGSAGQIRDRLSPDHWRLITSVYAKWQTAFLALSAAPDSPEAQDHLDRVRWELAAIAGAQMDQMTRDTGWRVMSAGRKIERLATVSQSLRIFFAEPEALDEMGMELLIALADSLIIYRATYQRRMEVMPVVDLLVLPPDNPRSIHGILGGLMHDLSHLPPTGGDEANGLACLPPCSNPAGLSLKALAACEPEGGYAVLLAQLEAWHHAALACSDAVGLRYFSHAGVDYRMAL
ncbi:MAG: circularly permuted type 2 ATP-grasp protein [Candidatus Protistobacter heckmanni]|nr:circularly permuted type 2 ATP-grasp protein [Candidatus Protistobacter heckmanni]